ncbi:hypothetical protein HOE425_332188 [Hoeflea sp. EC-HK425]|nr:hypothetical protein HOE425_332188 [Hoeflea sp. EC-HK425]
MFLAPDGCQAWSTWQYMEILRCGPGVTGAVYAGQRGGRPPDIDADREGHAGGMGNRRRLF